METTTREIEDIIKGRMGMYSFLSSLFLECPDELLKEIFEGRISLPSHPLINEGVKILKDLISKFKEFEEFKEFVKREYFTIFLDPFSQTISLYQSNYEGDEPYREISAKIVGIYKQFGYTMEKTNEPPDHVGIELAFMAASCEESLKNFSELKKQKWFLEKILSWIPRLCDEIENSDAKFYKGISKILRGFINMDKNLINELIVMADVP